MSEPLPHERRVQRYATIAFLAAGGLALGIILTGSDTLLGVEVPLAATGGLALVGAIAGAVAAARRSIGIAAGAAVALVLAVTPGGKLEPTITDYALGLLFGATLLAALELVHMTVRYERAHRAVERDNVPEEHVNRVTDEALKTLGSRAGMALGAAALAVGAAFLLSIAGPAAWREAIETTAPLGVAVIGLALLGAGSLYILFTGSAFRRADPHASKEIASDAVE